MIGTTYGPSSLFEKCVRQMAIPRWTYRAGVINSRPASPTVKPHPSGRKPPRSVPHLDAPTDGDRQVNEPSSGDQILTRLCPPSNHHPSTRHPEIRTSLSRRYVDEWPYLGRRTEWSWSSSAQLRPPSNLIRRRATRNPVIRETFLSLDWKPTRWPLKSSPAMNSI